jgi:hypothetical protein
VIECGLEQLTKSQEESLRLWLSNGNVETLIRVVKAKAQKCSCDALRDAIKTTDTGWKFDGANANLRRAQKYAAFLEVLKEVLEQKEYEIARLT